MPERKNTFYLLTLLVTAALLSLLGGCAKKPVPEPVPSPMTEAYLLEHMRAVPDPRLGWVSIAPLSVVQRFRFLETNATLVGTLTARVPGSLETPTCEKTRFLLFFSLRAAAWGGFRYALDIDGNRFEVEPYTSYIRQGIFYDNFFLEVPPEWVHKASQNDADLLLMDHGHDMGFTLPTPYAAALLHYLEKFCTKRP
jgi:hypothetical protein